MALHPHVMLHEALFAATGNCSTGALKIKPLDHWTIGPLDHWTIGPLDHWPIGPLAHWTIGPLANWPIGPLGPLNSQCRQSPCKQAVQIIRVLLSASRNRPDGVTVGNAYRTAVGCRIKRACVGIAYALRLPGFTMVMYVVRSLRLRRMCRAQPRSRPLYRAQPRLRPLCNLEVHISASPRLARR